MQDGKRIALIVVAAGVAVVVALTARQAPGSRAAGQLPIRERPGKPGRFELPFEAMGTDGRLEVAAPSADEAARACEPALEAIRLVERLMSTYREDSDVSRLNRLGAAQPVEVSEHTLRALRRSAEVSRLTGGAFDVTYAPLRILWRRAQREGRLPAEDEVARVLAAVGYGKLVIEGRTVKLGAAGMEVDVGGIAKGYAVDRATEALRQAGAAGGIVDIGGDLRLFGEPEPGEKWRVMVKGPPGVEEDIVLVVPACAVTTSGDYARYFTVEGRRFSHIVDPRTGWPVADVPSVTVVAADATTADGLATALSVMGPAEGMALVDSLPNVECMIMVRGEGGAVRRSMSRGFSALVEH